VLIDAGTSDDAAVYRIGPDRALVATVDFFTPIVDDPRDFGRIAAANALSDIYAMGARPLFALNLLAFPRNLLASGILDEILRGGAEICRDAGVPVVGGHSIDDPEPKFGFCVIGEVHPERIIRNSAARPGDRLVLTKPIGTGIISTAHRAGAAPPEALAAAVASMTTLNRATAEALLATSVRAATDITGFGLIGHLRSMLRESGAAAHIHAAAVPLLRGAAELAARGFIPGGTRRNLQDAADDVHWNDAVDETTRLLLCDAQTSGGLLIAVPPEQLDTLLEHLHRAATPVVAVVGEVVGGTPGHIFVHN